MSKIYEQNSFNEGFNQINFSYVLLKKEYYINTFSLRYIDKEIIDIPIKINY